MAKLHFESPLLQTAWDDMHIQIVDCEYERHGVRNYAQIFRAESPDRNIALRLLASSIEWNLLENSGPRKDSGAGVIYRYTGGLSWCHQNYGANSKLYLAELRAASVVESGFHSYIATWEGGWIPKKAYVHSGGFDDEVVLTSPARDVKSKYVSEWIGGFKADDGKLPWHLLPYDAIEGVVKVLQYGALKYKPRNWERGMDFSRLFSALQRHLTAWFQKREFLDPESKLPHLDHALCCLLFLSALTKRNWISLHHDDRPKDQP